MKKMLEFFKEICSVITPSGLRYTNNLFSGNENLDAYYEGMRSAKWKTESEVQAFFFTESNYPERGFNKLNKTFKNALLNGILGMGGSNLSEVQKEYRDAWKCFAVAQTLQGTGKKLSSIELAKECLGKAQKYEWVELITSSSRMLYVYYGSIDGDKRLYKKYYDIFRKNFQLLNTIIKVESYFVEVSHLFTLNRAINEEVIAKTEVYIEEVWNYVNTHDNRKILMCGFYLFTYLERMKGNYEKVIVLCDQAIERMPPTKVITPFFVFSFIKIPCYLQLEKHEEALKQIDSCLEYAPPGVYNWMITLEYQVMLGFHSQNYQLCYESLLMARPYFQLMPENIQEEWRILEGYILFFIEIGLIETQEEEKFKLGKFLNEVPNFTKDKAGHNVNIITIQILYFLQRKKYKEIEKREEAIRQYVYRYLEGEHTKRAKAFLKMLEQLSAGYFNEIAINRKADSYFQKLQNTPIQWAMQSSEIEIVPYEKLWELILEELKK